MRYREIINELFAPETEQINWGYKSERKWLGDFNIAGSRFFFQADISENDPTCWTIQFYENTRGHSHRLSTTHAHPRTSIRVMSVVVNGVREFIRDVKPDRIEFTGDDRDGHSDLYSTMVRYFSTELKQLGYKASSEKTPFETVFYLDRQT